MSDPEVAEAFACPRCGAEVTERFYGPCGHCRIELGGLSGGQRRDQAERPERFEPAMHVTPNAVATKE